MGRDSASGAELDVIGGAPTIRVIPMSDADDV
jgi:hypothetical protein